MSNLRLLTATCVIALTALCAAGTASALPIVTIVMPSQSGNVFAVGAPVLVVAQFTDTTPNVPAGQCTITWGDGAVTVGTLYESGGYGKCYGARAYSFAGTFAITVQVYDEDGVVSSDPVTVQVEPVTRKTKKR